ncbi:MAG: molybdopterin cofactor-binding domain-containing protein [Pseudomonadota bacterium]
MAAGGLLIAIGTPVDAVATTTSSLVGTITGNLSRWVRIAQNGVVTLLSNTSEIGQGTGTALAQILANELDLDWRTVRIEMAPIASEYFNEQWGEYATYGSGGVRGQFDGLRLAGAQARNMLISAAAHRWGVAPIECDTETGVVVHRASNRRITYGQLASAAAKLPVPAAANTPLMSMRHWRFIGKDIARLDIPSKVDGSACYGIDVQLPGMLIAAIIQSPRFGGKLIDVDPAPALSIRGIQRVVKMPDAVAVVADTYWIARKGLAALKPNWDDSDSSHDSSSAYSQALLDGVSGGGVVAPPKGSTVEEVTAVYFKAMSEADHAIESTYAVPFLSHATMEPMNATAHVSAGSAVLWLPTQNQSAALEATAKELGLSPLNVTIHTTLSGGGFGRRIETDFVLQAVRIARHFDVPVKMIWSREEDMQHDFYRPAAAIKLIAGLDAGGLPVALRFDIACESLLYYSGGGASRQRALPVDRTAIGAPPDYYQIPVVLLAAKTIDIGVPVGYWRSVALSQNAFAYECFIDELAYYAQKDPVEYRRSLLLDGGRERHVLDVVARHSGWERPAMRGRYRGVALARANGSVVAHVVELSVDGRSEVRIHRITTAIDCGTAVNPRNIRAQIEGSVAFGLSAAFNGKITIRDGAVEQSNFHDYPLIHMADMPPVQVVILNSSEKPGGAGEEAVGPIAPAVANALFAATGRRIKTLPFCDAGFGFG